MLQTYFKIALRSLLKNRLFSGLNVFGLALGLMVAILLLLYVFDELSFDKYHSKADRIYRVGMTASFDGKSEKWANVPNIIGPVMKTEIPEVKQQVRLLWNNFGQTAFVNAGEKKFAEKHLYWADSTLFEIFDIPLVAGNSATALQKPNTAVVSQSTAKRYFGNENALGKVLKIDNNYTLEITGVYQDLPANFTLDADLIGSFSSVKWAYGNLYWSNASYETYVLARADANKAKMEQKMAALVEKNVKKENRWFSIWLQPLVDIHLGSADISNASTTRIGDAKQVKILLILALVVLIIACINYMNLATARSQHRFREVGINKIMGATNGSITVRFYAETALLTLGAIGLSLVLLSISMPIFNQIAGKNFSIWTILSTQFLGIFMFVGALTTLIAGSYPAIYMSSFTPKSLLQTTFSKHSGVGLVRRSLVVIQFVASVILIISTIVFFQQLRFIQNQKLGYNPEEVVAVSTSGSEKKEEIDALINSYKAMSSVVEVCRAQTYPGNGGSGRSIQVPGESKRSFLTTSNRVTGDFGKVLDLELIAGKIFPTYKDPEDTTIQLVVNETTVKLMGYTPDEALGKIAKGLFGDDKGEIVGVVKDFHFASFHQPIASYVFHNYSSEQLPHLLVKLKTQDLAATTKQLEATFKSNMPNSAFDFLFLDQFLNTLYATEQRTATVVMVFSILAIFIACLGLFGLAAFTAEARVKEIGVRKVLGATVGSLVMLLSKDFLKLVVVSVLIASPVAYYFMDKWLADFASKINIEWWIFALAGATTLLIALLTVSYQAIKAALMNPVKSLKAE